MAHRIPLKLHTVLAFEGMECHIEEPIGQGYNSIVYKAWYRDSLNRELRHQVLVKELFPFHPQQKIYRGEENSVVIEPEAEALWEDHKESFETGNQIHLRLLHDHPDMMVMGANINSFRLNGTLYSVLGYTGGRSLREELNRSGVSLRRTAQRMIGLLDALEAFHKSGYLHLDISPGNIMLVGGEEQERLFLIDYNSALELGSRNSSLVSRKEGYSAPEISNGSMNAVGFPSDLYSVAAVFFRCLMGRRLTNAEALKRRAPEGQDSPLLKDMPQTVRSMVGAILKKGLHTLPGRRYQSIGQMRLAFRELIDRIDCVGVTHWSLWENGKRSVEELIAVNPSLRYLKDEKKLYPIRLEREYSMSLETYLDDLLSPEGKSGMILARGGMGKTTLLLHTAMLRGKCYSPAAPAVFYISLNGWDGADRSYIRGQILMRLRFKKEENTFDSAMHALHKLLEQPLKTKTGELPAVLLLLDGLNEVRGDTTPLIREINELNTLAGVRILATSRSGIPELNLETAELMPLHGEDVEETLGRNGLLIPRQQEILRLLRTPLILSIYIQAGGGGRQLNIRSEEELMRAYMDSLLEKEIRLLPEDAPQRWQTDAALNYVLPAIAAEVKKKGKALTERQMLAVVEKCRKTLRSPLLKRLFPRWIGRTGEILGEAETADQWYGIIIHRLLWQQLGMLAKEAGGDYRIFHQVIGEYLAAAYRDTGRRIARIQRTCAAAAALILSLLCVVFSWTLPYIQKDDDEAAATPYAVEKTEDVISRVTSCYSVYGTRCSDMMELLKCMEAGDTEAFLGWYDRYFALRYPEALVSEYREEYLAGISELCASGDQVAWSGLIFDGDSASRLITEAESRLGQYAQLLPLMKDWSLSERVQKFCPKFPEKVAQLLALDEQIMSKLYHQSCYPHLEAGEESWRDTIIPLIASIPGAGAEPEKSVESLIYERDQIIADLTALATEIQSTCESEKKK